MTIARLLSLGLLFLALTTMGCTRDAGKGPAADKDKEAKADRKKPAHTHGKRPNGGVVFDFGRHHAEFTVDHDKKECMILVLGDDETTITPVAAKDLTVTTKATKTKEGTAVPPMTIKMLPRDEKDGKTAKYVGTDPGLGNVADFEGTAIGQVDGRPSQGEFKE
jgi:hypothetical protein